MRPQPVPDELLEGRAGGLVAAKEVLVPVGRQAKVIPHRFQALVNHSLLVFPVGSRECLEADGMTGGWSALKGREAKRERSFPSATAARSLLGFASTTRPSSLSLD